MRMGVYDKAVRNGRNMFAETSVSVGAGIARVT